MGIGKTEGVGEAEITGNVILNDNSKIQKLYDNSTIFVTGASGFLGKLLVEKLLRSCNIKKIYILLRAKKGNNIRQRFQAIVDDPIYDVLREMSPGFTDKIDIIEGDVGQLNCGISEADRIKLINEVEFIFHGAATVRFDEALKTAVEINVRGTREMLTLARACSKLRAHVHISTAYSNCPLKEIDEKFYGISPNGETLINLVENMNEKTLNNITPGLKSDFPNTYSYTKSAAEDIVRNCSHGLPVTVVRPSIVISTANEPIPGWIDNIYGPTGVVIASELGLLRVLNCSAQVIADLVPGDYVVNGCIAAAWKTAKEYHRKCEDDLINQLPTVYNYVSSEQRPLTWELFTKYTVSCGLQIPSVHAIWFYFLWLTRSQFLYTLSCFFLHWIPAYIADAVAIMIGKKPMLRKAYHKIEKFSAVLSYFGLREWKFHNNNTQNLYKELCNADKHIFNFDVSSVEWEEYFTNYMKGIRIFILKDPMETVPQGQKKYFKLKILHYFVLSLICFGLLQFIWFIYKLLIG